MRGTELYDIAREFLDKEFDMKLEIPIFINSRLKRTFGYFKHTKNSALQIDISQELINTHPREVVIDVLKHELVHYALFEQKKPFGDGDKYFKDTLDRLGVSRTGTYQSLGKFHEYRCNCQGKAFHRKRKLREGSHCPTCKTLKYVGIVERKIKS